ncbi:MAG: hypothetical protein MJK14_09880, partial [Rivularia sp. ALOHA_DT_140]|nr:hypothetical protein [Rivularia sp. ALOHA_DT_140]
EISESTIEQEKSEVATSGLLPQLKMAILTNDYQRVKDITDPLPEPTKQELRVQLTAEEMGRCKELRREYELKLTTPNSQFPTPNSQALRQGTIVYPTCRQLKNKKCVLGTIDGSNYWVRLNNNSKGNGAVLYQADELSLQPPSSDTEPTNPNEEQLDLFNYEASEECEYLESIDD